MSTILLNFRRLKPIINGKVFHLMTTDDLLIPGFPALKDLMKYKHVFSIMTSKGVF